MSIDFSSYSGRRVLVTGHTGFKGAWLCEWLLELGAEVHGLALEPQKPSLFEALGLAGRMKHTVVDVLDAPAVKAAIADARPEFVFHLAAQALVRVSYRDPVRTFATNAIGTANILEAIRELALPCSIVVVTSDKCYDNDGQARSFKETDPLGGHDPYSASKAAAELVAASYRDSFFSHGTDVALATARAGNVIGGGDWAEDRLVPDCIRALQAGKPVPVRNPDFTRPWQHVLEPLGGYLLLGAKLEEARGRKSATEIASIAQAFNFGPEPDANRSVRDLVEEVLKHWPGTWEQTEQEKHLREAPLLGLAIDKARHVLDWKPRWDFSQTVARTVEWYRQFQEKPAKIPALTRAQIKAYQAAAAARPEHKTKAVRTKTQHVPHPRHTAEWQENFLSSSRKIKDRIDQAVGGEAVVYFSASRHTEDGTYVDNLDEIAVKGRCVFEEEGDEGEAAYTSASVENPTWLQVAVFANEMLRLKEETHHCFLEGLHEAKTKDGLKTVHFRMGS